MSPDEQVSTDRYPPEDFIFTIADLGRDVTRTIGFSCNPEYFDPTECVFAVETKIAQAIAFFYDESDLINKLGNNEIKGWDLRTSLALLALRYDLRELAVSHGLEWLLLPSSDREVLWQQRVSKWKRWIERPYFEAALAIAIDFDCIRSFNENLQTEIFQFAELARQRNYSVVLSPPEAHNRYAKLRNSWLRTNCLGTLPYDPERRQLKRTDPNYNLFIHALTSLEKGFIRILPPFTGRGCYKSTNGYYLSFDWDGLDEFEDTITHSRETPFPLSKFLRLPEGVWLKGLIREHNDMWPPSSDVKWDQVDPNVVIEFCRDEDIEIWPDLLKDSEAWHKPKNSSTALVQVNSTDSAGVKQNDSTSEIPAAVPNISEKRGTNFNLRPCDIKAGQDYQWLIEQGIVDSSASDLAVYEVLKSKSELEGSSMPPPDAWMRYLRKYRAAYGLCKNQPRSGRTGSSIAKFVQID